MLGSNGTSSCRATSALVVIFVMMMALSSFGGSADQQADYGAAIAAAPPCLLHGYVNDSVTHEGIGEAIVAFISSESWMDSTQTDETGYYELVANQTELIIVCQWYGYYPYVGLINASGESEYRLDIELVNEPTVPVVSATIEPDRNISEQNRLEISFTVEDYNLWTVSVLIGQVIDRSGDNLNFTITGGGSLSYSEYEEDWIWYGDLAFYGVSYEDDILEGGAEWAAWTDHSGYLSNSSSSVYIRATYTRCVNFYCDYGIAGLYYNETISGEEGFAFFDGTSDEYLGFEFYNLSNGMPNPIPDAPEDDPEGEFVPLLPVYPWNLSESADFMELMTTAGELRQLERRSVVDLTFTQDYTVQSGEYLVLFAAIDDVLNVNGTAKLITVDTECPVAYAGENQEVRSGEEVVLEGSATDNVGIESYVWTFDDWGTEVELEGETVEYVFTEIGNHTVTLAVTDGGGNKDYDFVIISVTPNEAPVADAGSAEITIDEDTPVQFDGTGSYDEDGEVVGYLWEIVELNLTFTDAEFEFTFSEPGVYEVTLVVEDDLGLPSESDNVTVTVTDVTAPTADAGEDIDVDIGEEFVLDAGGSSDNVGVTEYLWSCEELEDWEGDGVTISVIIDVEGTYTFTLETRDAAGNSDTDVMTVTVGDPNEAPTADAGPDINAATGETITFDASASTDDGDIENYTWTFEYDGETVELYGETAEFTFDIDGEYTVELTVTDDEGTEGYDEVVITVNARKAGTSYVPFAAAALIVIAIVLLSAVLLRRRKVPGPP